MIEMLCIQKRKIYTATDASDEGLGRKTLQRVAKENEAASWVIQILSNGLLFWSSLQSQKLNIR